MSLILTLIFELLGVIAKNPISQKVILFSFFFGLVTYTVNFFISKVGTQISEASQILALSSYLGFTNGLTVVFNFLITGFIIKQILAFIRS